MYDSRKLDIRFIDEEEWEDAMLLTYRTFLKFDASMFTEEGIKHFKDFITDNFLKKMFCSGEYQVVGAYYEEKMIGVISLRGNNHISLLFVDEKFHHLGVGRGLLMTISDYARLKLREKKLTVNAAPYATEFYHKVGFVDDGPSVSTDGITYTPMTYVL